MDHPITPAVRVLRQHAVAFEAHLYDYVEHGGTSRSSNALGVDEHRVVKTLVFETDANHPLIVLMHGDKQVSTKSLARHIGVKSITPCKPEVAEKWTGYVVGGTSPFGTRTKIPVFVERTILELDRIWINGGKRGFLVAIEPKVLTQVLAPDPVSVAIEKSS
jgi:Cys-tRNA(Pro) deacylase